MVEKVVLLVLASILVGCCFYGGVIYATFNICGVR
jgi:hypothetical protein